MSVVPITPDFAIRDAIWTTLQGDSVIRTGNSGEPWLALDPTGKMFGSLPALAIFSGSFSGLSNPVTPSITYRCSFVTADRHFENPEGGLPTAPIDECRFDFEIWCGPQSNDMLVSSVILRIEKNFRNSDFTLALGSAINGSSAASMFRAITPTYKPQIYDSTKAQYFALYSLIFKVQR